MKKFILLFIATAFAFVINAQTVYVTNTGEKYHTGSCRYLRKSKISIELKEALNQGYDACKVCGPPVTVKSEKKKTNKQCTVTTKSGTRCKQNATNSNGKCKQHGG